MVNASGQETGSVVAALLFQMLLVVHFALRRIAATVLNVTSHRMPGGGTAPTPLPGGVLWR